MHRNQYAPGFTPDPTARAYNAPQTTQGVWRGLAAGPLPTPKTALPLPENSIPALGPAGLACSLPMSPPLLVVKLHPWLKYRFSVICVDNIREILDALNYII